MTTDKAKSLYFITAIVGIGLMFMQIQLYRRTFIPFKVPLLITITFTVIGYFVIQRHYKKTYGKKSFFFPFMQSFVSFGFIFCYCFLALNFYLADNSFETAEYKITSKYTIGTRNPRPVIQIDYNGAEKEIIFYSEQRKEVDSSKSVILNVSRGFLGYDIFKEIQLNK